MGQERQEPALRIGVSMRISQAEGYCEPRDALAHDWHSFINKVIPDALWLPIPNLVESGTNFLSSWGLNAFILTGGIDLNAEPLRDKSENNILDYAIEKSFPVLGICRGLQLMARRFNGEVIEDSSKKHVATAHNVSVIANPVGYETADEMSVNSYHNYIIKNSGELVPFAFDNDGNIEAVYSNDHQLAAIMWHPERNNPVTRSDAEFVRSFFGAPK